jgi:hypothetical protein
MPNGASNQIYNGGLRCNNREVQEWRSEYRTAKGKSSAPKGREKGGAEVRERERERGRNCAPACPLLPSFISDGNAGEEAGEGGAHEAIYREEEGRGAAGPEQSRPGQPSLLCGVRAGAAPEMGDSGGSVVSVDVERISFGGKVRRTTACLFLLPDSLFLGWNSFCFLLRLAGVGSRTLGA